MKRLRTPPRPAGLAAALVVLLAAGLVVTDTLTSDKPGNHRDAGTEATGAPRLVSFDSCAAALEGLRESVRPYVGAYGLSGAQPYGVPAEAGAAPDAAAVEGRGAVPNSAPAPGAAGAEDAGSAGKQRPHSGTNNHERGVEEPDLVQTDGNRVVSVVDGTLRVVDVESTAVTAELELPGGPASQLLLHGDRALVLASGGVAGKPVEPGSVRDPGFAPEPGGLRSRLVLVDLAGPARVVGTLELDGEYVDARAIEGRARIVVRSVPRLPFTQPHEAGSAGSALRENREILEASSIEDWLPRYELTGDGTRQEGTLVDCARVSHPDTYSGTAMLTVLTVELSGRLGTGDPVSIVAEGDTVYGTESSLYVADDGYPTAIPMAGGRMPMPEGKRQHRRTEIHQFDLARQGPPRHVASGSVEGTLLNQYSLSEHEGHLRVATTTGAGGMPRGPDQVPDSVSAVTVLGREGSELTQVGRVGGLGKGERIYAVRFVGPVGYVVTFRETDPLYTLDLADPTAPRAVGELKITGYSAYLHDAGSGRLIGVGQEADRQGRTSGLQVSLFDVGDPATPARIAQHQVPGARSEVESDPHAFLYWPPIGLIVLPYTSPPTGPDWRHGGGALVLRLDERGLTEVGTVRQPAGSGVAADGVVRRAMVIGDRLWTVSSEGALVSQVAEGGTSRMAWIPFG
ncbi:beta-propeller domain-containing protein [Amycolatopsis aidingensis]|uniref:beta-propeller domain-containing protein n=1 Tax=Amycolatopsis aidingensis TaxID=2842453 RepID=UPI001C0BD4D5|nr:beta-propeller domain-containing protein [Amycolatopsis aidingensis]